MTTIIAFGGTKGGVGKTGLARATAVESARKGIDVLGIDLNPKQCTLSRWSDLRRANGIEPTVPVRVANNATEAITTAQRSGVELVIIDAPGEADAGTLKIAQVADLFVQVASRSLDDLEPLVNLAHELIGQGIAPKTLVSVAYKLDRDLSRARDDHAQICAYVSDAGFRVLDHFVRDLRGHRNNHNAGLSITEASHVGPRVEAQAVVHELIDLLVSQTA